MGSIISSGVGSGLDVAGLVQKLVEAEGSPKSLRLDKEEAKAQAKLSAFGSLRSALASFRDAVGVLKNVESFRGRAVTLSTPDHLTATATSGAVPGSYAIQVDALASAHKIQSDSNPAASQLGTGTLTLGIGALTFDVAIDASNNTLAGIAAAINDSDAGEHLIATVLNDSAGNSVLTLAARATGEANELEVQQSGGDGNLAALVAGLDEVDPAQDARVFIDGFEVKSSTNTVSGAITGVELSLLKLNDGTDKTTVTVGYDRDAARKSIDSLVKGYNGVVDAIKTVASYNVDTKQGGPLFGDAGVRNIAYQLRRELTAAVSGLGGSLDMLTEIGVSADLDGKLSVDGAKLDAAFAADFDAIGDLFAADGNGIAVKLDQALEPYLRSGGLLDSRTATLKSSIDDIGDRREVLTERLEALQARYLRQFNALDGLLAQLQSTSNFLTQQLSRLPGNALFDKD